MNTDDSNRVVKAINEVGRELKVREKVYPRLVDEGRLSADEAERRRAAMADARQFLFAFYQKMRPSGQTSPPPGSGPLH